MAETTAVREKPILFSAPEVRAIMEGRKTQTRRVMTRNVPEQLSDGVYRWRPSGKPDFEALSDAKFDVPSGWAASWCRYGKPGDRLWVRKVYPDAVESWIPWDETEPFSIAQIYPSRLGDEPEGGELHTVGRS